MVVRSGPFGVVHQVSEYAGLLYIGGIVADDATLDMADQTRQLLDKLEAVLTAHGATLGSILLMHVFITDMTLKGEMNRAWAEVFSEASRPSRVTLGITSIEEGMLVETSTIAAKVR